MMVIYDCSLKEAHQYKIALRQPAMWVLYLCIDMYNNDVGKKSAQKFMKQTGDLKAATLYFAS